MSSEIVVVKSYKQGWGVVEFFKETQKHPEISQNFLIARLNTESIKDILREYIVENGISSLFHFTLTCDAVTHPGIHVDDIEKIILGFVSKLNGVEDLYIIDPYFYSDEPQCVALFGKMIAALSKNLKTITFFTNGKTARKKDAMHAVLSQLVPLVTVGDVKTDKFHDRYWIDAAKHIGIVMGTSLNGIGKKIALVDNLSHYDAEEIAQLAYPLVKP
ncbi:hypothetical protein EHZ19_30765 [Paraburkholderia bannensis]|nr:hypothetical protein [Paraburkholderia bannensis]RQM44061.1 hypothetical protein EHZ19_30765 [Paraburkholderia bannensis]